MSANYKSPVRAKPAHDTASKTSYDKVSERADFYEAQLKKVKAIVDAAGEKWEQLQVENPQHRDGDKMKTFSMNVSKEPYPPTSNTSGALYLEINFSVHHGDVGRPQSTSTGSATMAVHMGLSEPREGDEHPFSVVSFLKRPDGETTQGVRLTEGLINDCFEYDVTEDAMDVAGMWILENYPEDAYDIFEQECEAFSDENTPVASAIKPSKPAVQ